METRNWKFGKNQETRTREYKIITNEIRAMYMKKEGYIPLENLEVYKESREYSKQAWDIFDKMDWQKKKVIGDQMI